MKSGFKISLICNLALLGAVFFLFSRKRQETTVPSQPPPTEVVEPAAPTPADANPFRWNQLESTNDYRQYVANLRSVGCPESTVEDIVHGDANRAFSFQRRKLKVDGSEPGPWSTRREMQLAAFLLGQASTAEVADEPAQQPAGSGKPAAYPLVFQDVNLDNLGLKDDKQKQAVQEAIAEVRQQFVDQIGGPNQDPADPAYLTRWKKAQSQSDDALRGELGVNMYMAYETAAADANTTAANP